MILSHIVCVNLHFTLFFYIMRKHELRKRQVKYKHVISIKNFTVEVLSGVLFMIFLLTLSISFEVTITFLAI